MSKDRGYTLISVDLDDLWTITSLTTVTAAESILTEAVENALNLFDEYNIKATFFAIAADYKEHGRKAIISSIINAGHEIANHSLLHRYYQTLDEDEIKQDIIESTKILEDCVQCPILGFKTPGWGCNRVVLDTLEDLGYQYDASWFPSPWGGILQCYHSIKSRRRTYIYGSLSENLGIRPKTSLQLIPLTIVASLPFYGSIHIYPPMGMGLFSVQYQLVKRYEVISYIFHGIDFVDTEKYLSGSRFGILSIPFEQKTRRLRYILDKLTEGRISERMKDWQANQAES